MGTVTTEIINVTPSLASAWLATNTRNRPVSKTAVKRYKRDMESGNWRFSADPIRFDTSNHLIDGQHRLAAVSELEGHTFQFLVVRGLDRDSQLVMDQGVKRTAGQQLALLGVKNANHMAAGAKLYMIWTSGLMFKDNKIQQLITAPQIEQWVSSHPAHVEAAQRNYTRVKNIDSSYTVTIAAFMRFREIDPDAAVTFLDKLSTGAGLEQGSPILALINRQRRIQREGFKISNREMLAFYIQSWNAWREGRSMDRFVRPRGGSWAADTFPKPF